MKKVELTLEDFEKMIKEIKDLKREKKELLKINSFLNNQIQDYNDKFAKQGENNVYGDRT